MHEQHDDPLAGELRRLSAYSGEQASVWRAAVERHRAERQRQLWVWVRRPAPAAAAACLALLVTAVSLRPVGPTRPAARVSTVAASGTTGGRAASFDRARTNEERKTDAAPPVMLDAAPRSPAPDDDKDAHGDARYKDEHVKLKKERREETVSGAAAGAPPASRRAGAPAPAKVVGPAVPGLPGSGGGQPDEKADAGNGGARPAGRGDESPTDPSSATGNWPNASRDQAGNVIAGNSYTQNAGVGEQFANVRIAVPDVLQFSSEQIPQLLDVTNGEMLKQNAPAGQNADASQPLNVSLWITEDRLQRVLGEFRKSGEVQEETVQLVSRDERLRQIDRALAEQRTAQAKADVEKVKGAFGAAGAPAGSAINERQTVDELYARRARVAEGRDYTTLNLVVVPQERQQIDAGSIAPPPGAPLGTRADKEGAATDPAAGSLRPSARAGMPSVSPPPPAPSPAPTGAPTGAPGGLAPATPPMAAGNREATPTGVDGVPAETAGAAKPAGKISVAAREGLSDLGDASAGFVRTAIGSVLYWGPAVVALGAGVWWWRRRIAAGAHEPPPGDG